MATYSTSALIDEVLDKAKDSTISRSRVLTYIQRAQDTVLGRYRFKFSEKRAVETLISAATIYTPANPFQQIVQLVLTGGTLTGPSTPIYLPNADFFDRFPATDTYTSGVPCYYTEYGGDIYWDRPLGAGYTVGIRYITPSPTLLDSTSNTPVIPVEFSEILVRGGLAGIENYRENFDVAALHERRIEDLSEDMLGRYGLRKRQPGKARTVLRRPIRSW